MEGARPETLRPEILKVVREVVAPLVHADGGRVYVVQAAEDAVSLHLTGRFSGCQMLPSFH